MPEQPPVVREFLQIRNHAVQLTSERLVSSLSHLLNHFIVIAGVTGQAFLKSLINFEENRKKLCLVKVEKQVKSPDRTSKEQVIKPVAT